MKTCSGLSYGQKINLNVKSWSISEIMQFTHYLKSQLDLLKNTNFARRVLFLRCKIAVTKVKVKINVKTYWHLLPFTTIAQKFWGKKQNKKSIQKNMKVVNKCNPLSKLHLTKQT